MAYTTEQRVLLGRKFYQTACVIRIQREFQVKFELRKAPGKSGINRLVNKFGTIGIVIDDKKGVVSKKKSVRPPENFQLVQLALT
jgi:hypothetical protein